MTLVVEDIDDAIGFYTESPGFEVTSDDDFEFQGESGRWVTVGLPEQDIEITFAEAETPFYDDERRDMMQRNSAARAVSSSYTTDCEGTVEMYQEAGVEITHEPISRSTGERRQCSPTRSGTSTASSNSPNSEWKGAVSGGLPSGGFWECVQS